jgi:hypothetical protein
MPAVVVRVVPRGLTKASEIGLKMQNSKRVGIIAGDYPIQAEALLTVQGIRVINCVVKC